MFFGGSVKNSQESPGSASTMMRPMIARSDATLTKAARRITPKPERAAQVRAERLVLELMVLGRPVGWPQFDFRESRRVQYQAARLKTKVIRKSTRPVA